jgi:hypothetical protein
MIESVIDNVAENKYGTKVVLFHCLLVLSLIKTFIQDMGRVSVILYRNGKASYDVCYPATGPSLTEMANWYGGVSFSSSL